MSIPPHAAAPRSGIDHPVVARASDPGEEDARFALASSRMAERNAMVLFDADWIVAACNRGVPGVLGFSESELVGKPLESLFPDLADGTAFAASLRNAAADAHTVRENGWMLRRDGLRMWAEITCVSDAGSDGRPRQFWLTVRDATLQYRASRSLRSQADVAAAIASARNLFLGSVSHELRAALAPIATSAILLERQAYEPARQQHLLGIIRRNVATAARLLEDLLGFSTQSANKLVLRPSEVDLHALVGECADVAQQQAAAGGIELRLDLSADPGQARVHCDPERVRQVVVNLLGNAVKFTPAGGTIVLRTASEPDRFTIEVSDTGAGIDPLVLPFIFDPFAQGGPEVTKRHGGFGLGLAISADIARQHGGHLAASSAGSGRGASFRLELPRGQAAPADAAAESPAPADAAAQGRAPAGLHVLYVEDNADAADAMRYALGTLGWSMAHASTCSQARELMAGDGASFDIVLADLGLPDGSGLELGHELSWQLPVVALTAYGAPVELHGFADQLLKPAELSEVQRALMKAVVGRSNAAVA